LCISLFLQGNSSFSTELVASRAGHNELLRVRPARMP
jgi:hypothetical protein